MDAILKIKKELRKEILQLRDAITEEERREKSRSITEKVSTRKEFTEADKILLFASYNNEVDTSGIYEAARSLSKDVYYPKVIEQEMEFFKVESEADLKEGYRGIREPDANPEKQFQLQPEENICIIMPGAVFDRAGNRIGYGGGYYDKYLYQLSAAQIKDMEESLVNHIYKVAIAYECQMVEVGLIQREPHDIKANVLITENQTYSNLEDSKE